MSKTPHSIGFGFRPDGLEFVPPLEHAPSEELLLQTFVSLGESFGAFQMCPHSETLDRRKSSGDCADLQWIRDCSLQSYKESIS